jgi:predicted ester cyclase
VIRFCRKLRMLALACVVMIAYTFAADTVLIEPRSLIVDRSLSRAQVNSQVIAARRYDTFWNTGHEALARAALAPNFADSTLPAGRPQGLAGPLAASKLVRAAIPDASCEIEQMIVAGDRVVAHLRFRGHFTGHFGQVQGHGQTINFIFIYHIDDVSRDEPFLVNINNKSFAVVPYMLHMNDIVDYEVRYFGTSMYADDLKAEFDALYAEAEHRRRMMSVSAHDRIAGRPPRTKTHEEFITYAQSHSGVVFLRKDEIARFTLSSPQTIREEI